MEESSIAKNVQMSVQLMFPDPSKEFQCPICAKYFSRKCTLDAHMLIHKGEKPHACPFCGKCFRQKGTLMRHKALHSSKNLFHCSLCNRGFRQKNVFIHHLRHRHNVCTETLDRRKYRTALKDYQSIMDTLPSFVHADSTAIASSEKHLDAMLLHSIKPTTSCSVLSNSHEGSNVKIIHTDSNTAASNMESILCKDSLNGNISLRDYQNFPTTKMNDIEFNQNCGDGQFDKYFEDRKPIVHAFGDVDSTVSSGNNGISNISFVSSPRARLPNFENSTYSSSTNVSSSIEVNDENLICIPCQLSFTNELEFKCHLRTHVQSVLLGESSDLLKSPQAGSSNISNQMSSKHSLSSAKSSNRLANVSDCPNIKGINISIKEEILDSEPETLLESNGNSPENSLCNAKDSSSSSKPELKCPICKICFKSEYTFKKHARQHDSYVLLKLLCESYKTSKLSCVDENMNSVPSNSVLNAFPPNTHVEKSDNCVVPKVQENDIRPNRCSVKNKKLSNYITKSSYKKSCFQCGKSFSSKLLFEYHRQLHLSPKSFVCRRCRKSFSSKRLLLLHTRLHHMKAFSCSTCSRVFNYRSLLKAHQQTCINIIDVTTLNGSILNFPLINMESLLDSRDDIVGVIPVYSKVQPGNKIVRIGIPVMSVSDVKKLYSSSCNSG